MLLAVEEIDTLFGVLNQVVKLALSIVSDREFPPVGCQDGANPFAVLALKLFDFPRSEELRQAVGVAEGVRPIPDHHHIPCRESLPSQQVRRPAPALEVDRNRLPH